jgi:hypothetical protein
MRRYVLYIRVSTAEQKKSGLGIEANSAGQGEAAVGRDGGVRRAGPWSRNGTTTSFTRAPGRMNLCKGPDVHR